MHLWLQGYAGKDYDLLEYGTGQNVVPYSNKSTVPVFHFSKSHTLFCGDYERGGKTSTPRLYMGKIFLNFLLIRVCGVGVQMIWWRVECLVSLLCPKGSIIAVTLISLLHVLQEY